MPRIPEETLEKIKREVSIQSLVEAKGIKLTPHGKNLIGLCPFHDDKDPSLVITPDKNLWHLCFARYFSPLLQKNSSGPGWGIFTASTVNF